MKIQALIFAALIAPIFAPLEAFADSPSQLVASVAEHDADADFDPWRIFEDVDEMTDEVTYILSLKGKPVRVSDFLKDYPSLVLQIKSTHKGKYLVEILIRTRSENFSRGGAPVAVRFDKGEPTAEIWSASQDRDAAFAPKPYAILSKLRTTKTMTVRYVTSLDMVRTTSFDLSSVGAVLDEVKRRTKLRQAPAKH